MNAQQFDRQNSFAVPLKVSRYDRVSAALMVGIFLVGSWVLIAWMMLTQPGDLSVGRQGIWIPDTSTPADSELPVELIEPLGLIANEPNGALIESSQLDVVQSAVRDTLSRVAGLQSHQISAGQLAVSDRRRGLPSGTWGATSAPTVLPFARRVLIEYQAANRDEYVKQLSGLQIQLAAVHRLNNEIQILIDPANQSSLQKSDRQSQAATVHFGHRNARLQRWDIELMQAAQVDVQQSLVRQFFLPQLVAELERLELEYLASVGRQLHEVSRTEFTVVPAGASYEFRVTGQSYRH